MTDPTPPGAGDPAPVPADPLLAPPADPLGPVPGTSFSPAAYPSAPSPEGPAPHGSLAPPPPPDSLMAPPAAGPFAPPQAGSFVPPPAGPFATPAAGPFAAPHAAPSGDPYLPQPYGPPAGYGAVPGQPGANPYDYGYAPYAYPGLQPPRNTDGMAIASLVVSCVSIAGFCTWGVGALLGVLGAILGHVARRRINASGAGGAGIALAGIIVGWAMAAIGILLITLLVVLIVFSEDPSFQ